MPAAKGNRYAAKPAAKRLTGKGRTVVDLGEPLKKRAQKAAEREGQTFTDWLKDLIREKLK